ncbi:hypothetical protein AALB39_01035 [Lachnospiraceae bacterium 54-53]
MSIGIEINHITDNASKNKRPHIIIFNPDEMRCDAMGHMGNPAAVTPFLDQFTKEEAVSFRYAFCQNRSACPAGAAFLQDCIPMSTGTGR